MDVPSSPRTDHGDARHGGRCDSLALVSRGRPSIIERVHNSILPTSAGSPAMSIAFEPVMNLTALRGVREDVPQLARDEIFLPPKDSPSRTYPTLPL